MAQEAPSLSLLLKIGYGQACCEASQGSTWLKWMAKHVVKSQVMCHQPLLQRVTSRQVLASATSENSFNKRQQPMYFVETLSPGHVWSLQASPVAVSRRTNKKVRNHVRKDDG